MKKLKFAENFENALKAKKMTQNQIAIMLGTSQATINRWIKGINEPDFLTLFIICDLLNETPNTILGYED